MEELIKFEKKIMPVLGCMQRRKYVEAYLRGDHYLDPCLICDKRPECVKQTVYFAPDTGKNW
jgi:hypothetical protein